jgi:IS5 family transposase
VSDSSTLVKLVKKYGPDTLDQLNEELVRKAREKKVIRGQKLRMDTTVIESNIHHPTDAGLLADGVRMMTRVVDQLKEAGASVSKHFRDQTHAVKERILTISKVLQRRTGEAQAGVAKATAEILGIARRVVTGAKAVAHQVTEVVDEAGQATSGTVRRVAKRLRDVADLTEKIVQQTKEVLAGNRRIPDRVVSLADPDARPIKKGKLKSPTEFGHPGDRGALGDGLRGPQGQPR